MILMDHMGGTLVGHHYTTDASSHHGLRVRPDILVSKYDQGLGSNLRFQNPEKLLEGG